MLERRKSSIKGERASAGRRRYYNGPMASIAVPVQAEPRGPLRPLNILRDLPQVADLIELCFETTMDDDGHSYVQQMRNASADRDFLAWANRVMESTSMPLAGYVWEEDGRIVGNVSLVFQAYQGRKLAMIANVATHPNSRRKGIGRALTERAMWDAQQKGVQDAWLQVRHDNATAIRIYADLGFEERARRTTYHSQTALGVAATHSQAESKSEAEAGRPVRITHKPSTRQWPLQRQWLERAHPTEISWYARWDWNRLGPGFFNSLYRMFVQYDVHQWAATRQQELLATASWVPSYRVTSALWLAASEGGGEAVTTVLQAARRELAHYRKVSLEYPAGELRQEIEAAGFEEFRTLLWMRATPGAAIRRPNKKET